MPHATALDQSVDRHDDILIQQFLDARATDDPFGLNRELEPGEKADDAENYEDISDGDLAEDEDPAWERESQFGGAQPTGGSSIDLEPFTQDVDFPVLVNGSGLEDNAFDDDLFGEGLSSPVDTTTGAGNTQDVHDQHDLSDFDDSSSAQPQPVPLLTSPSQQVDALERIISHPTRLGSKESPPSKELQRQQELLDMSRKGAASTDGLPAPPENREELLSSLWPKFERNTIPKFIELLPPKRASYHGRSITKPPKPITPTKVNLELAMDQEKGFKVSSLPYKPNMEESNGQGIINIQGEIVAERMNEPSMDIDSDFENEVIRGISWQDLQIVCEDWDTHSVVESPGSEQGSSYNYRASKFDAYEDFEPDRNPDCGWPSAKVSFNHYDIDTYAHIHSQRRKLDHLEASIMRAPHFLLPSFQDPEQATSNLAKTITLDLNDSRLLIDHVQRNASSKTVHGRSDFKRAGRGAFTKGLSERYNISNDDAYDLLKENHQSKVRSMLGNVAVEHSLPAVKLQWPFVSNMNLPQSFTMLQRVLKKQSIKRNWTSRMQDLSIGQA